METKGWDGRVSAETNHAEQWIISIKKNSADLADPDKVKKIGKNNFLRAILENLEDKTELDENIEQLLKHMNLACYVLKKTRSFMSRFEKTYKNLPDISIYEMKFAFHFSSWQQMQSLARVTDLRFLHQ